MGHSVLIAGANNSSRAAGSKTPELFQSIPSIQFTLQKKKKKPQFMGVGGRDFRVANTVRRGAQRQLRSQQSFHWSINSCSPIEHGFNYRVHSTRPAFLNQTHSVHTHIPCFFKGHFNILIRPTQIFSKYLLSFSLLTKIPYSFPLFNICMLHA